MLREVYATMRVLGCSRRDVMEMPTRERKFYLNEFMNEEEKREEQMNSGENNSVHNSGKGKRTRRVGGEELKQKMKNGDLPQQ